MNKLLPIFLLLAIAGLHLVNSKCVDVVESKKGKGPKFSVCAVCEDGWDAKNAHCESTRKSTLKVLEDPDQNGFCCYSSLDTAHTITITTSCCEINPGKTKPSYKPKIIPEDEELYEEEEKKPAAKPNKK